MCFLNFFKEKFLYLNIEFFNVIGIVLFGLIDLSKEFMIYGYIIIILKKVWRNLVDVVGFFKCEYGVVVLIGFEIDINVLVLVEMVKIVFEINLVCFLIVVYIIVGIGVGFGVVVDGFLIYGFLYFEGGYMMILVLFGDDYLGGCEFY